MLLNISYNDPRQKKEIDNIVGKPFSLQNRWKMGGIGSGKLVINSSSIVRFRSLLETYGLIIPYFKLKLYKGKSKIYSIYMDQYYIKVNAEKHSIHEFFKKINDQKVLNTPQNLEDL